MYTDGGEFVHYDSGSQEGSDLDEQEENAYLRAFSSDDSDQEQIYRGREEEEDNEEEEQEEEEGQDEAQLATDRSAMRWL